MFQAVQIYMKTSDAGIDFIKGFEELRLDAYVCPAGLLTIGYGHVCTANEGGRIDESHAYYLLRQDLANAENCVNACVKTVTQNQFDALVSFVFNVGCKAFRDSTLLRKLLSGQDCSPEFLKWNHAAGKVLAGLTKRRTAEMEMFKA